MGGFLGIGNSSAKTDRGNQLSGINASWNVYNRGLPLADTETKAGQTTTNAGISGIDAAKQYWQGIMSGNKNTIAQATAPTVNTVNTQADAARRQEAEMGTSRGGGVNQGNQEAETGRMSTIANTTAGLAAQAPGQLEKAGVSEAQVGEQQMRDALSALGLDQSVADEIINSSIQSRPISIEANNAVSQQWSNFMGALGF